MYIKVKIPKALITEAKEIALDKEISFDQFVCLTLEKSCEEYYLLTGKTRKPKKPISPNQKPLLDNFGNTLEGITNGNTAKQLRAVQKIEVTIKKVDEEIEQELTELPDNITAYIRLLISRSKELFKDGIGQGTMYKKEYKHIWQKSYKRMKERIKLEP